MDSSQCRFLTINNISIAMDRQAQKFVLKKKQRNKVQYLDYKGPPYLKALSSISPVQAPSRKRWSAQMRVCALG